MSIISVLVFLICVGFVGWLITFIPMDGRFKQLIFGIMIFVCILYLIQSLGIYNLGIRLR